MKLIFMPVQLNIMFKTTINVDIASNLRLSLYINSLSVPEGTPFTAVLKFAAEEVSFIL